LIVSLCPELLFSRKQPLAGFIGHDGEPCYFCAKCLMARIEECLREMTPDQIVDNISFSNCDHFDSASYDRCPYCARAIPAMLVYLSMGLHLKATSDKKMLTRLDETIRQMLLRFGRINVEVLSDFRRNAALLHTLRSRSSATEETA
jgi:hypothetical protein